MKRVIGAAALLTLVGLTAAAVAGGARHASPTKLTVWVGWSAGKELITFKKVAAEYDKAHPDVTLDVVGGIVDQKIVAAIRAGQAPDVVSSFNSYDVGIYCGTKAWLDLKPYLDKSHISTSIFPPATMYYTQYAGTRCALPLLADTYGLYYNKTLFAKAGIKSPPKTISELTADAKKLTVRNKDGSLKVVGLDPFIGFYENVPERWVAAFGGTYIDAKGNANLSRQAAWQKMLKWQKSLIDWYGYNNLVKF
jgi:ABC-type glycerol-3-phosphate transport system substrate-binding protein